MAHLDRWGGSGHRLPDSTLLRNPNASSSSGDHATVGNVAPGAGNNDAAMMKYMKDDRFFPYFGFANKMVPPANTYGQQDEENFDLPDAYTGSNVYLRNIIISQVQKTEMWGTAIALPWKKQEGSMEIAWDEWHFNDTMMTRTPEEAVSRLLTSHFDSFKSYTVRFGIALIMEHGFWKTEKGQQHYALQLIQIRNAIAFTAQYGVTLALLNPPKYIDDNEKYLVKSTSRSKNAINNWFQDEIDEFAIMNKTEDGWLIELGRLDEKLKRRNQTTGDMIIVPSGSARYVRNRPENKWSFLSGGIRKFDKSELTAGDGRMVVESIMHKMGEHQPSRDPTYREVVIGSFFHMLAHHLNTVPLDKFKTCMLDQLIYSEDKDDFYKMSYRLCVRTLGLYDGWETATKVGEMPLTANLGQKVFEGASTWGEVYQQAGMLDKFIKQLNGKDEITYRDFLDKFIATDPVDPPAAPAPDDDEEKYPAGQFYPHYNDEEKQAAAASDATTAMLNLQLQNMPESQHGHRHRLQIMLSWLKSLDDEAAKLKVNCDMHKQVSAFVEKNKGMTRGLSEEAAAACLYELAWKKAQELLILYGLDLATKENRAGATPFEQHVLQSSTHKSNGGTSREDERKLRELNEQSPYWRPAGESAIVTEVELVAPEPGAGDANTNVKRLQFATNAFTLASSFLVLFNLNSAAVQRMIDAPDEVEDTPNKTLFNLSIHWNKTAPNQRQLLDRAALMQFSIVMSALHATLHDAYVQKHKTPADESKYYTALAKQWIKLATPVHMLTGSSSAFAAAIERAKDLPTLDYQAPIDTLIDALQDALVMMYTERTKGELSAEKVVKAIKTCEVQFTNVKMNNHTRAHGAKDVSEMQGEAGAAFLLPLPSIDEVLLRALYPTPKSMGTFHAGRREARKRVSEEDLQRRVESLQGPVKKLKEYITNLRQAKKDQGLLSSLGPVPAPKVDVSSSWRPTYVKLMGELEPTEFQGTYLIVNEHFINYNFVDAAAAPDAYAYTLIAKLAGADPKDPDDMKAIKAQVGDAVVAFNSKKKPPGTQYALEWTRLWMTRTSAMRELMTDKLKADNNVGTYGDAAIKFYSTVVRTVLAMSDYNFSQLREAVAKTFNTQQGPHLNETYPNLFLSSVQANAGNNLPDVVTVFTGGNGAEVKRISIDALRNFLLTECSIQDGFFWKWGIENDMVQALGMIGFKNAIRYNAGTMIILSAWGQTGNTFYGHADMMLSDNAATKMHYGHFTYYSKSQVLQSRKIIHGRNCVVNDYLGGNGHKVWDASNPDDKEDYDMGVLSKDVFFVPVLMNHEVDTNHMDITGSYHPDIGASEEANKATFYDSAAIYRSYWGWRNNTTSLTDNRFSAVRLPRENTVVFQAHQHMYNPGSGKMDLTVMDKGHWGDRVYPGCGRVRRGIETYLKPVKYDNTNTMGFTL